MSNTPSDAEISAAISAAKVKCVHPEAETTINIARAVLAKWGAPQPVVREPLSVQEVEQLLAQWSYELHGDRARYLVRMTEQAHGITQKGGNDAE